MINYKVYEWGPLLVKTEINDEFRLGLLERSKHLNVDFRKSLAGHIDKEKLVTKPEDLDYFMKNIQQYLDIYFDEAWPNFFHKNKKPEEVKLLSLWVNFMRPGECNPPHIHGDDLSFVLYLDVPEMIAEENRNVINNDVGTLGGIRFMYGSDGLKDTLTHATEQPATGDLFIFPSHLTHFVAPFKSDCTRISMSGNFVFNRGDTN
jgi:hypothetical protein